MYVPSDQLASIMERIDAGKDPVSGGRTTSTSDGEGGESGGDGGGDGDAPYAARSTAHGGSPGGGVLLLSVPPLAHQRVMDVRTALLQYHCEPRQRLALVVVYLLFDLIVQLCTEHIERNCAVAVADTALAHGGKRREVRGTSGGRGACNQHPERGAASRSGAAAVGVKRRDGEGNILESFKNGVLMQRALDVLAVVARSEFRAVLVPYFYRPLLAKAGIRAKLAAEAFLDSR